jgi:UDP-3-O-[3-hydroxymyristoyl] N-acetylglucosamine deacetylase/3-hydroxyacyl-[acyl-carrier-protein] dehydratase
MIKNQRSLESPARMSGIGLHTGVPVTMTLHPAPADHGLVFLVPDATGQPVRIPARVEFVDDLTRSTCLRSGSAVVHTVEHVLASLSGLGIDNCLIELDAIETPIADGSSREFIRLIREAGIREYDEPRVFFAPDQPITFRNDRGVDIVILPSDEFRVTYMVDYAVPGMGTQYTSMVGMEEFEEEYAGARTFCLLSELLALRSAGLIQGGSLDSGLVLVDRQLAPEALMELQKEFGLEDRALNDPVNGVLDNRELRFVNEPVRHKVLDLIGDLCLLGQPLRAHVLAARGGHATHVEVVKLLKKDAVRQSLQREYQDQLHADRVFDIGAIERIMPHRYPMLLVDRILELKPGEFVRGMKCVTRNEPFFDGHFPGHPIMPGVLIVEAMGQCGGVLMLNSYDRPEEKVVYFSGLDAVKFRKPVVPGDVLMFELTMVKMRRGFCSMKGRALVDGQLVCTAEMSAVVMDKNP